MTRAEFIREAETWLLREAMRRCKGNTTAAARELGVERKTMYWLAKRTGTDLVALRKQLRGVVWTPLPMSAEFRRFLGVRAQV